MSRADAPLSSEIAGVSADAEGAVTLTLRVRFCAGDAPGDVALRSYRLADEEVAKLIIALNHRVRLGGPFSLTFPPKPGADDGSDA
jgi:hypothetical protein